MIRVTFNTVERLNTNYHDTTLLKTNFRLKNLFDRMYHFITFRKINMC